MNITEWAMSQSWQKFNIKIAIFVFVIFLICSSVHATHKDSHNPGGQGQGGGQGGDNNGGGQGNGQGGGNNGQGGGNQGGGINYDTGESIIEFPGDDSLNSEFILEEIEELIDEMAQDNLDRQMYELMASRPTLESIDELMDKYLGVYEDTQ